MAHIWSEGLPLEVTCDADGAPTGLRLRGGWHSVVVISARWRVRRGWWRAARWREYVTVATAGGLLITLARELPAGAWQLLFLHD